jgi:hypothetical protein
LKDLNKPKWVVDKESITHDEELEFVGQMGVDAVVDGKLPNGEDYDWSKQDRKLRRKWRMPKLS